ncbi:class I SAM-dependent methyltransferase [Synechococcus sp. CS-1325]|uniref:class I SAM-dependent methyltransferase n=1 Tax=unclassified Synechococcus TaxID=2626047 RepID=UPI0021A5F57B|nr:MULTISPECIES: class I SAM-dependent methyltransferase [unclassified Synechococcus]MCT0199979.1 class I SAM-dependent methyltransferase [Synechococcus sp. CS-1325]MCT0211975.1 class I SAM-dependent methyltransferase [Synechococcus sp. CS-1326]MCT0232387.1 class I SAM-dependent methyltransferase [Synechococcus sp. CS-1327]
MERAIGLCTARQKALDVGCGTGGRILSALEKAGFELTGLDVSQEMLRIARDHHPTVAFMWADVCTWEPAGPFDLITAWDSLIHVPLALQGSVLEKLCHALNPHGVILITVGGSKGELTSRMQGVSFYHSSLNDHHYLEVIKAAGCRCLLLECDQFPEEHMVLIAVKE